ncbi:MAG: hypothetical protein PHR20_09075 [Bacteroidales bacterium]|nr:hypothetical protein [Bacteroidales bacterium]
MNFKSLTVLLLAIVTVSFSSCCDKQKAGENYSIVDGVIVFDEPEREAGQQSVLQLAVDPIEEVRIAFVGLGMRGNDSLVSTDNP